MANETQGSKDVFHAPPCSAAVERLGPRRTETFRHLNVQDTVSLCALRAGSLPVTFSQARSLFHLGGQPQCLQVGLSTTWVGLALPYFGVPWSKPPSRAHGSWPRNCWRVPFPRLPVS